MQKLPTNSSTLLKEVHEFNRANWEDGCICAGCGQLVKLYPYSLNRNAARSLILIYHLSKQSEDGWVHVQNEFSDRFNLKATAMSYILLKHWGFIVPMGHNDDEDKNASGYWAITHKGVDFVMHRLEVPKTAMVYNNRAREFKGKQVTIADALTDKFSYKELMGNLYIEPIPNLKLAI
jgi:hypothetical protein